MSIGGVRRGPQFLLAWRALTTSVGESRRRRERCTGPGAEGATTPEPLRHQGPLGRGSSGTARVRQQRGNAGAAGSAGPWMSDPPSTLRSMT